MENPSRNQEDLRNAVAKLVFLNTNKQIKQNKNKNTRPNELTFNAS